MNRWLPPVERVLLTAWVGGMWTVGFVVAPILFSMLGDRMLAGTVAGRLFSIVAYGGMVVLPLLLASGHAREGRNWWRQWRCRVLMAMLLLVLVGQFGLTPRMQAIRDMAGTALVEGTADYKVFAVLHGISSTLFLANAILGLLLVAFARRD